MTERNIGIILEKLQNNKREYGSPGIEHLGDLIYFLEKYDKKRDLDDDELRKKLLHLSEKILDRNIAKISFKLAYNYKYPPPSDFTNFEKIKMYINKNWNKMDFVDRQCLISFEQ